MLNQVKTIDATSLVNGSFVLTTTLLNEGIGHDMFEDFLDEVQPIPIDVAETFVNTGLMEPSEWVSWVNRYITVLNYKYNVDELYGYLTEEIDSEPSATDTGFDALVFRSALALRMVIVNNGKVKPITDSITWRRGINEMFTKQDGKVTILPVVTI